MSVPDPATTEWVPIWSPITVGPEGPPGPQGPPTAVADEGTVLPTRATLNFAGAGVTVTDGGTQYLVTIPGGAPQTPWTQDIDGANFMLGSVANLGIGTTASSSVPVAIRSTTTFVTFDIGNFQAGGIVGFKLDNDSGDQCRLTLAGSAYVADPSLRRIMTLSSVSPNGMAFKTSATATTVERMRITADGSVGIGLTPNASYKLDVAGDVNISPGSVYRINGVPLSTGGSQTPWTQNIDGNNKSLSNASAIGIGAVAPATGIQMLINSGTALQADASSATGYCELLLRNSDTSGYYRFGVRGPSYIEPSQQSCSYIQFKGNMLFIDEMRAAPASEIMRIVAATGNVGIGNTAAVPPFTGAGPCLMVGSVIADTKFGSVSLSANTTSFEGIVSVLSFCNYARTGADKQIASILTSLDGAVADSGTIRFYTANLGTMGERMRITAAGHVGIGTAAPEAPLHIYAGPGEAVCSFNTVETGPSVYDGFVVGIGQENAYLWNRANGVIEFGTNDVSRMVITAAGNVGVGNPAAIPFAAAGYIHLTVGPNVASAQCGIITTCGHTTQAGIQMGAFSFSNNSLVSTDKRIASIDGITDGTPDSGAIRFFMFNAGAGNERMRITAAGNVGIGTLNPQRNVEIQASTPSMRLSTVVANEYYDIYRDISDGRLTFNGVQTTFVGFKWLIGGSEKMRIDGTGNVGIGTGSPINKLTIAPIPFAGNQEGGVDFSTTGGQCRASINLYIDGVGLPWLVLKCPGVNPTDPPMTAMLIRSQTGQIVLPLLQSTNPGAGSKQLWYSPADGLVHFAA